MGSTKAPPSPRTGLDEEELRALLRGLDADELRAAEKYEILRYKLIVFFAGRQSLQPEELADVVLDRLARKVAAGLAIADLASYAYGVARRVQQESNRATRRHRWLLAWNAAPPVSLRVEATDARLECLRTCAGRLAPEERQLVLDYYEGEGRDRQERRRALAQRLAVAPPALRVRVFRLRSALEECTRRCLAGERGR